MYIAVKKDRTLTYKPITINPFFNSVWIKPLIQLKYYWYYQVLDNTIWFYYTNLAMMLFSSLLARNIDWFPLIFDRPFILELPLCRCFSIFKCCFSKTYSSRGIFQNYIWQYLEDGNVFFSLSSSLSLLLSKDTSISARGFPCTSFPIRLAVKRNIYDEHNFLNCETVTASINREIFTHWFDSVSTES